MSALRIATPQGIRLIDLGPSQPAPMRGYSLRGHMVTPTSGMARVRTKPEPPKDESK